MADSSAKDSTLPTTRAVDNRDGAKNKGKGKGKSKGKERAESPNSSSPQHSEPQPSRLIRICNSLKILDTLGILILLLFGCLVIALGSFMGVLPVQLPLLYDDESINHTRHDKLNIWKARLTRWMVIRLYIPSPTDHFDLDTDGGVFFPWPSWVLQAYESMARLSQRLMPLRDLVNELARCMRTWTGVVLVISVLSTIYNFCSAQRSTPVREAVTTVTVRETFPTSSVWRKHVV